MRLVLLFAFLVSLAFIAGQVVAQGVESAYATHTDHAVEYSTGNNGGEADGCTCAAMYSSLNFSNPGDWEEIEGCHTQGIATVSNWELTTADDSPLVQITSVTSFHDSADCEAVIAVISIRSIVGPAGVYDVWAFGIWD